MSSENRVALSISSTAISLTLTTPSGWVALAAFGAGCVTALAICAVTDRLLGERASKYD